MAGSVSGGSLLAGHRRPIERAAVELVQNDQLVDQRGVRALSQMPRCRPFMRRK